MRRVEPVADQPGSVGAPVDMAAVRETHVSILLFLGDRVLKLRKPLRLDFADFSTLSARGEDCRREVELNRRLAPDVYLGVADVALGGEVLDHLVVMRRLPAERALAHLVCAAPETVWGPALGAVARTLADFHARADRSSEISAHASRRAVTDQFDANMAAMARFVGPVLASRTHDAVVRAVQRYATGRDRLFTARMAAGQICDGHGDLQADDIYCLDDGPRILDCLEFDEHLRFGDVAGDVAFLAMDLERLGARSAASQFVRDYEEHTGAPLPPSLVHFYVALRACVRTKVACIRHEQGDPDAAREANELLELAHAHLEQGRVRLVLVGGLPGSGKSTLAAALGETLDAIVLRSDDLRRGRSEPTTDHPGPAAFRRGRYSPLTTQGVYGDLLGGARERLLLGQSVVLDASWIDASHPGMARALATECWADLAELHCIAPPPVTEQRITLRLQDRSDPSEATVEVGRAMARLEDPWPSAAGLDTARAPEVVLAEALRIVRAPRDEG